MQNKRMIVGLIFIKKRSGTAVPCASLEEFALNPSPMIDL